MQNWSGAIIALNDMNAFLPDEYRIVINTAEYEDKVNTKIGYICNYCKEEVPHNIIKVKQVLAPMIVNYLSGEEMKSVWFCPKCQKENLLSQTKMIETKLEKPTYLKVVSEPPKQGIGIYNKRAYKTKIAAWLKNFDEEISHQLGLLRQEYLSDMEEGDQ